MRTHVGFGLNNLTPAMAIRCEARKFELLYLWALNWRTRGDANCFQEHAPGGRAKIEGRGVYAEEVRKCRTRRLIARGGATKRETPEKRISSRVDGFHFEIIPIPAIFTVSRILD
jgi:hypothetical protein